jgi:hypothetical protein
VARGTAVTISILFGVFLVLPILAKGLPKGAVSDHIVPYLPASLGDSLWHTHIAFLVSPWAAVAWLAGYVAALAAIAVVLLRGRDT